MNLKMTDLRNQMQSVKQELRMAQKVFQSQAPSLLVGPGLGSERGLAGTKGSIQDQRVLSPVSIMLLPLGSGSRSRNFLPAALEADPCGERGRWLAEGPCVHALWCPANHGPAEDSAVLPGRVLELSSCCVNHGRSWVFPSQATLDLGACQDPPPVLCCL